jgi:hypothetical protein
LLPELYKNKGDIVEFDQWTGEKIGVIGTKHYASSENKEDVVNLFLFLSHNTDFEWSVISTKDGKYTIGTWEMGDKSPGYSSSNYEQEDVIAMVHSHPHPTRESEVAHLGGDKIVQAESWQGIDYYTYNVKTAHLFLIKDGTHKRQKSSDKETILKILR